MIFTSGITASPVKLLVPMNWWYILVSITKCSGRNRYVVYDAVAINAITIDARKVKVKHMCLKDLLNEIIKEIAQDNERNYTFC